MSRYVLDRVVLQYEEPRGQARPGLFMRIAALLRPRA